MLCYCLVSSDITILEAILDTILWEFLTRWVETLGVLTTEHDEIDRLGIFENTVTFLEVIMFRSCRLWVLSLLKFLW